MRKRLLYRGRHTSATAICLIYSITLASLTSDVALAQTVTPLTTNPGGVPTPTGALQIDPVVPVLPTGTGTKPAAPQPGLSTRLNPVALTAKGIDIAPSANGSLWVVATDKTIWQFNGARFVKMPLPAGVSGGHRVAVSPEGVCWLVAFSSQRVYYWDTIKRVWVDTTVAARDVAVGSDGSTWIISTQYQLQKWNGSAWETKATVPDTSLFRIAVDPAGNPWVTGTSGTFQYADKTFRKLAVPAWDIAIGGDGMVWVTTGPSGYGQVQRWDGQQWVAFGGVSATNLAVDGLGTAYSIDEQNQAYSISIPGPVLVAAPITSPGWNWIQAPGKMLCSAHTEANDCGRTVANWVGKHEVKMKCDSGFYDPIYGGTCWKCPDDDGSGPWIRSLDPITTGTACWRSPKETFSSAIKVKSPAWAWDCPSGSFWDGYSPDGAGGSCWRCPDHHPRRTGYHIKESNACTSPSNQTDNADLLSFSGCPSPDRTSMGLNGSRQPGRPFLDVGAGGCFACPVMMEDGTFVISVRNGVALYTQDAESTLPYTSTTTLKQGCDVAFRYKASPFSPPGLGGLVGALEVVMEKKLLEYPDMMTGYLYALADGKGLSGANATTYVKNAWEQIATDPMNSEGLRSVAYLLLQGAVKKAPANRTQSEQRLIDSFSRYIVEKRSYYARVSLDMYDAWRLDMDNFEASIKKSPLKEMLSPGTVPLDFKTMLMGLAGTVGFPGAAYLAVTAGYNVRLNQYNKAMELFEEADAFAKPKTVRIDGEEVVERTFETYNRTARLSRPKPPSSSSLTKVVNVVRGLTGVSSGTAALLTGLLFIEIAATIIASVAAANLLAIETARPELQMLLSKARQPVDVTAMMSTDEGLAAAMLSWAQAIDTTDQAIPALTTLAQNAKTWAAARNYARPKGL